MNAPTPGWHPDPTGRHEYRYWEGGVWTDDVSDGGATSVDPIGAAAPTPPADATQQYAPQPGPAQPGPQPGGFPAGGPGYGGYPSGSGQFPAGQPVKSGPSTGLLVGLAAVAVALIAGIAYLVTNSGDDDDTTTGTTATTEDTGDGGDTTDSTPPDDGDLDLDEIDDDTSSDGIVDLLALGIQSESDQITDEQAQCAAQAIVDELGVDTIVEMSASGTNPFSDGSLTTEQQVALTEGMLDCIPLEVLAEIGMESSG